MPLRTRIFIIISLIVSVVLGISVFLLILAKQKAAAPTTPAGTEVPGGSSQETGAGGSSQNNQQTQTFAPLQTGIPIKPATTLETEQNSAKQLAKIFIERYNTYSTQNNSQNIKEVQSLVTDSLWKKLSGYIGKGASPIFSGVTTMVISTSLDSWQTTSASVTLKTRRAAEKNDTVSVTYVTYTVSMVKENGSWLIDSFATVK